MSWEVRATDVELYAQFGERGPVFVIVPDGSMVEQFRDIDILEPVVPMHEAVDSVLELIKDVPLAKAARVALAKALQVDVEAVGTTSPRKTKESA